jgi:hypothetical protein
MDQIKRIALSIVLAAAILPPALSQTISFPLQITEIRRGEKVFCEVVVDGEAKDNSAEGYALVVGINTKQSIKRIRDGVVKDASAKGAELCKVVSGKVNQEPISGKAVWMMIGLQDKPAGSCGVPLPDDITYKGPVHVKAQVVAWSDGKWIEKSKLFERTIKP